MYDRDEGLGLAVAPVIGAITDLFGGSRITGAAVYREDGARWSAAKRQWELPPGTRAGVQSPAPSGPTGTCTGAQSCLQSMSGGPVRSASGDYVVQQKASATAPTGGLNPMAVLPDPRQALPALAGGLPLIAAVVLVALAFSRRR